MKLLLDQNISYKLVRLLAPRFDYVKHVRNLGLVDASDLQIWTYARDNGYTIITFDSVFIDLSTLKSSLPKVIRLNFGNSTNLKIANKLLSNFQSISEFVDSPEGEAFFLEID